MKKRKSVEERRAYGKSLRQIAHRVDQAAWTPTPGRDDPVDIVVRSNAGRLADLIPIDSGKPFATGG